jgi:hypothetical protein
MTARGDEGRQRRISLIVLFLEGSLEFLRDAAGAKPEEETSE